MIVDASAVVDLLAVLVAESVRSCQYSKRRLVLLATAFKHESCNWHDFHLSSSPTTHGNTAHFGSTPLQHGSKKGPQPGWLS